MSEDKTAPLRHLGLILDGNRRWARENNVPTFAGHQKGYDKLNGIVKHAVGLGIPHISAYIFSKENWNRSKEEVSYLMELALKIAKKDIDELHKEDIRVIFLGSKDHLSDKLIVAINEAEQKTKDNKKATLGLCFNYGGRQEIVDAAKKIIDIGIPSSDVTEEIIEQNLYSKDFPNLDLLIRTSGEHRISNFMLYRAAYAELIFLNKFWPDFTNDDLDDAIEQYNHRKRRFGK